MMRNEFEQRTGFKVSASYFDKVVTPMYMSNEIDKDEFCKEWKGRKMFWMEHMAKWEANRAHENWLQMLAAQDEIKRLNDKLKESDDTASTILHKLMAYEQALREIRNSIPEEI